MTVRGIPVLLVVFNLTFADLHIAMGIFQAFKIMFYIADFAFDAKAKIGKALAKGASSFW